MLLYDNPNIGAVEAGNWHALKRDERAYRPILVNITGTATVEVQVRNSTGDTEYTLKTLTASEALMIAAFPQFRVNISSVTAGASVRVSLHGAGTDLGA